VSTGLRAFEFLRMILGHQRRVVPDRDRVREILLQFEASPITGWVDLEVPNHSAKAIHTIPAFLTKQVSSKRKISHPLTAVIGALIGTHLRWPRVSRYRSWCGSMENNQRHRQANWHGVTIP